MLPIKLNERNLLCEIKKSKVNLHCIILNISCGTFRPLVIPMTSWTAFYTQRAFQFFSNEPEKESENVTVFKNMPLFQTNEKELITDVTDLHYYDGSTRFALECQFEISEDETTNKKLWEEKLADLKNRLEEFVKTGLEEKELFTCATCYAENKIDFLDQDGWKIITRDGKLFAQTTIYFE